MLWTGAHALCAIQALGSAQQEAAVTLQALQAARSESNRESAQLSAQNTQLQQVSLSDDKQNYIWLYLFIYIYIVTKICLYIVYLCMCM